MKKKIFTLGMILLITLLPMSSLLASRSASPQCSRHESSIMGWRVPEIIKEICYFTWETCAVYDEESHTSILQTNLISKKCYDIDFKKLSEGDPEHRTSFDELSVEGESIE